MWGQKTVGTLSRDRCTRLAYATAAMAMMASAGHATVVIEAPVKSRGSVTVQAGRYDPWVSMAAFSGPQDASRATSTPTTAPTQAPAANPLTNDSGSAATKQAANLSIIDDLRPLQRPVFDPVRSFDLNLIGGESPKARRAAAARARVAPRHAVVARDPYLALAALGEEPQGSSTNATPAPSQPPAAEPTEADDGMLANYEGKKVFAANTKYFQDFEDGQSPREWELGGITDMEEFGRFAGPFRNTGQTLNVQAEPDVPYLCEFDLLFIATQLGDPNASDLFQVIVDGQPLISDNFVTMQERNQKFNGERPDFDKRIYKRLGVNFTPHNPNGVVTITFICKAAGLPGGETWGLDNVHIDVAPKQTLGELGGAEGSPGVYGSLGRNGSGGTFPTPIGEGKDYSNRDDSFRPNGPTGPRTPPPALTPAPGVTGFALVGSLLALRRRRN